MVLQVDLGLKERLHLDELAIAELENVIDKCLKRTRIKCKCRKIDIFCPGVIYQLGKPEVDDGTNFFLDRRCILGSFAVARHEIAELGYNCQPIHIDISWRDMLCFETLDCTGEWHKKITDLCKFTTKCKSLKLIIEKRMYELKI